jgi:endonuclease YncB( thermonuclease family)
LIGITWPFGISSAGAKSNPEFAVCGTIRKTCVVDGDTIWLDGVKIRVADIDTPEISSPRCDAEYALGIKARDRLVVLLNGGEFALEPIGNRDEDRYGRKLRVIVRRGRSLGDQLVSEGLARTWTGRREPWC